MPEIPEIPEFPDNPELSRHPETPEIPEIPEIPIRKGRPSGPETRFSTLSGRFWSQFPEFFKVALRERFALQRKGLNLDFDWHARYIGAFLHFAKRPTINKNRRKTAPQTVHKRGMRKKLASLILIISKLVSFIKV